MNGYSCRGFFVPERMMRMGVCQMPEEKEDRTDTSVPVLPADARGRFVRRLQAAYRRYFNITPAQDLPGAGKGMPDSLICRCDFDVTNAQYILTKKNVLWSADSHEYCYIFSLSRLTGDIYRQLEHYVYEEGMKLIHPGKGHMCSNLTLLVVCDECDEEGKRSLKKCRLHKNFRFSFYGWMDFHTAMAVLGREGSCKGCVVTNFSGHDNAKLLRQLLRAA